MLGGGRPFTSLEPRQGKNFCGLRQPCGSKMRCRRLVELGIRTGLFAEKIVAEGIVSGGIVAARGIIVGEGIVAVGIDGACGTIASSILLTST